MIFTILSMPFGPKLVLMASATAVKQRSWYCYNATPIYGHEEPHVCTSGCKSWDFMRQNNSNTYVTFLSTADYLNAKFLGAANLLNAKINFPVAMTQQHDSLASIR